ncbi:MAG TPA: hypothetical protein VK607_25885 [Kofleriaceae bacterium]|nr:hypothetical protein [Kofleriaceae bacterium]
MNKNGMTDAGTVARSLDDKLDSLKDTMKEIVDQGAQRADALKSRVVDAKDQAVRRGGDLLDRTTSLIKAHPIKAVGIAFATGYIGMRLFRR